MNISLSSSFAFNVLPHKEKLRLVVIKDEQEFVCRIENRKNLNQFIANEYASIFKGRLQLIKDKEDVFVQVKGEIIGKISKNIFEKSLTVA